ncbi:MAG: DUF421 domain-containing protein [Bacillota bacterium]
MENQILATLLRGIATFIFVLFLSRLMGRKLISQMTFFDFVVGVSVGSLSANLAMGPKNNAYTASTALATFTALCIISGYIHIKSFKARKIMTSEPVTLIDAGNIVQDNLKKIRLTVNELNMKLREKNIFNMADVEFAIMETDGKLSVLPKADKVPLTPSHLNISAASKGLMKDIIIDGNVIEENLVRLGLTPIWLQEQLLNIGVQGISDVFYAGIDNTRSLYVSKKNTGNTENHGKYGVE